MFGTKKKMNSVRIEEVKQVEEKAIPPPPPPTTLDISVEEAQKIVDSLAEDEDVQTFLAFHAGQAKFLLGKKLQEFIDKRGLRRKRTV